MKPGGQPYIYLNHISRLYKWDKADVTTYIRSKAAGLEATVDK